LGDSSVQLADDNHTLRVEQDGPSGEGYRFEVCAGKDGTASVKISAQDERGVRWALTTLKQVLIQSADHLPELIIEDEPAFPMRGVMLDISRDRVPLMSELHSIVNQLASFKYNHLQLYTEHTFAYNGHEEVWKDASPMTPSEVRELDKYCYERGITLAANQNCFGHMERWLKHPRYAHLAETHDFWEWGGKKIPGPFSLAPLDPGSIALVEDLLTQLLPNFSSGLVNIGCDEALDVGQGRTREEVARRGGAAVYYEFVKQVAAFAERLGFRPMYWADIALSHPDQLERISDSMIALAWGYEPNAPFADWVGRYNEIGQEVWICPGTSSWRSITGRTTERRGNLAAAAAIAGKGASGFLVTDWGDAGHRQQWPVSLIGLAEAAEYAWNGSGAQVDDTAVSLHAFGDPTGEISAWLNQIGDADLPLRQVSGKPQPDGQPTPLINSSCLFNELTRPLSDPTPADSVVLWQETLERLQALLTNVPATSNAQFTDELKLTARVALLACEKAVLRRSAGGISQEQRMRLADELEVLVAEHRRLWLLRSRPGGLDDSCSHYERIVGDLRGETNGSK